MPPFTVEIEEGFQEALENESAGTQDRVHRLLDNQRPTEFSAAAASFADVNRTVVAAALRGLKNAVRNRDAIDWDSTLVLAQEFFEWREQHVERDGLDRTELRALGWFVAAGAFPVEWWAPRVPKALGAATESSSDLFVPLDDMMAQVAEASGDLPEMALEVLEIVVRQNEHEWHEPYLVSAETILAQVSEHPELKAQARKVADTLARAGYEQFERFVPGAERA